MGPLSVAPQSPAVQPTMPPSRLVSAPPPLMGPLPRITSQTPPATGTSRATISPALSDFIDFQTMMASSRYLHLKEKKRVSVAKTSFFSAVLTAGLTAIPVTISAINGQSEKVFLVPILGTLAAIHGAMLGLLLNHEWD